MKDFYKKSGVIFTTKRLQEFPWWMWRLLILFIFRVKSSASSPNGTNGVRNRVRALGGGWIILLVSTRNRRPRCNSASGSHKEPWWMSHPLPSSSLATTSTPQVSHNAAIPLQHTHTHTHARTRKRTHAHMHIAIPRLFILSFAFVGQDTLLKWRG